MNKPWENFEIIEGGKKEEPQKTREQKLVEEANILAAEQSSSISEEDMESVERFRKAMVGEMRKKVLREEGRILFKDEVESIGEGAEGLFWGNRKSIIELQEKFPESTQYFENVLKKINEKE